MLVIRREQMDVLARPMRDAFVEKTLAGMPECFPDDPSLADKEAMRAEINYAIDRAAMYGITRHREVGLFALLVHEFGPGFETQDDKVWISKILRASDMDGQAKMDLIYARLQLAAGGGEQ